MKLFYLSVLTHTYFEFLRNQTFPAFFSSSECAKKKKTRNEQAKKYLGEAARGHIEAQDSISSHVALPRACVKNAFRGCHPRRLSVHPPLRTLGRGLADLRGAGPERRRPFYADGLPPDASRGREGARYKPLGT